MCVSIMTEQYHVLLKMSSQVTYCMEHHLQRIHERIRPCVDWEMQYCSLLVFGVEGSVAKVVAESFVVSKVKGISLELVRVVVCPTVDLMIPSLEIEWRELNVSVLIHYLEMVLQFEVQPAIAVFLAMSVSSTFVS